MTETSSMHDVAALLAERQQGVISRDQLLALGMTSPSISRMRGGRIWESVTARVLRIRGSERSDGQHLMAAVLDAGDDAFLSGPSAAAWWGVAGFPLIPGKRVNVTRPRGRRRRPSQLAIVRGVYDVGPDHVTHLRGIPISVPARTVFEIAALASPARAARACDTMLSMRLTTVQLLRLMLDDWSDRGRRGTVAMREILDARPLAFVPPASNLESRFADLVEAEQLGPYRRQVGLGGEDWIGRVDFVHDDLPLVIEVLSERYHSSLSDREADGRRFAALELAGFTVLGVWEGEIWSSPADAVERIRAAERRLRRSHVA